MPSSLPLVIDRSGGVEVCEPDTAAPPVVHVTSERQGFAARALVEQGEAVLDVGEANAAVIRDLLHQTGAFEPRLADAGDVRLLVDGADFQPSRSDPFVASGELDWLSDAAVLAHEFLGDPLELRNLSAETLAQRIGQARSGAATTLRSSLATIRFRCRVRNGCSRFLMLACLRFSLSLGPPL